MNVSVPEYQSKLPYPVKVKKDPQEEQFKKFIECFDSFLLLRAEGMCPLLLLGLVH